MTLHQALHLHVLNWAFYVRHLCDRWLGMNDMCTHKVCMGWQSRIASVGLLIQGAPSNDSIALVFNLSLTLHDLDQRRICGNT